MHAECALRMMACMSICAVCAYMRMCVAYMRMCINVYVCTYVSHCTTVCMYVRFTYIFVRLLFVRKYCMYGRMSIVLDLRVNLNQDNSHCISGADLPQPINRRRSHRRAARMVVGLIISSLKGDETDHCRLELVFPGTRRLIPTQQTRRNASKHVETCRNTCCIVLFCAIWCEEPAADG